ncbi:MAG: nucleotide exchange factor GrpE [Betaproteobacteria bacterium]|nr:MAG: nucleotide exchange factor GrpE [Betaproteobacteria bacterium]
MADDPATSQAPQTDALAPEPEPRPLDALLAEAQAKIEEQHQAWLRALADAENARKRAQADVAQARKFAIERFVDDLLPVIDSLEAALDAGHATADSLRSGVQLTLRLLRTALERANVAEVAPAPGARFDPHRHQAMAAVEAPAEPNTIVAVMQKGYVLNERVVRPALVTVAKAREAAGGTPPQG